MMSQRRLSRSTTAPAQSPSTSRGPNCSAVLIPSATPLPVSVSTSQSWATRCIQVPTTDTAWPVK
jgi:hypothetical protein